MNAKRMMIGGLIAAAALLGGCYGGYSSWPPVPGDTAGNNINEGSCPVVMATALRWTARRFPPVAQPEIGVEYDVPFAVNLPPGADDDTHDYVVKWTGPHARAMTRQTEDLPTYHVKRIDLRGPVAEVDIVRPVIAMNPGPDGQPVYQGVTVFLRGGQHPWKVERHRVFPMGLMDVPARTYHPAVVRADAAAARANEPPPPAGMVRQGETKISAPEEPEPMGAPAAPENPEPAKPGTADPAPTAEPGKMEPVEPSKP